MEIDEDNMRQGLLGLVMALLEVIKEALEGQALRRMEGGRLTEQEVDRLGTALMDLEGAIEGIKRDQGIEDIVRSVREELDGLVDGVVNDMIDPERWEERELGAVM